jgi:hypothetical protein
MPSTQSLPSHKRGEKQKGYVAFSPSSAKKLKKLKTD